MVAAAEEAGTTDVDAGADEAGAVGISDEVGWVEETGAVIRSAAPMSGEPHVKADAGGIVDVGG